MCVCVCAQAARRSLDASDAASNVSVCRQQGRGRSPSPGPVRGRSPRPVSGVNSRLFEELCVSSFVYASVSVSVSMSVFGSVSVSASVCICVCVHV